MPVNLCFESSDNLTEYNAVSIRGDDNDTYYEKLEQFKSTYSMFIIKVHDTSTLGNGMLCTIIYLKPELQLVVNPAYDIEL